MEEKKEKTKTYKSKNKKDNQILNFNIDNKIQNLRNNAMEKIKLYTKSIDQRIKQINTESIFKPQKSNNYQPINSKIHNSNPFRTSGKRLNGKTNNNKNSKNAISI